MYDVITIRCISMCARVTCIFFYCASLTCTVCMYIYICIFNIYCIVRSVPMREDQTLARTPRRSAEIFFPKRRDRARSIARFSLFGIIRSSSLTQLFPGTSLYRSVYTSDKFLSIPAYSNPRVKSASRRSTSHVCLRYQFLKIF